MGQIKGLIYKGNTYSPTDNDSLNGPFENAFDWLIGQAGLQDVGLVKLKTGFGINKDEVKLKARAKLDLPGDRAKVKLDLIIDGSAEVNNKGYVKEFYADDARGSVDVRLKNAGGREIFALDIQTNSPIKLVKEGLGGDYQAVFAKIDFASSDLGPLL